MLTRSHRLGRRQINFADHAIERYYERTDRSDASALRRDLDQARWSRRLPSWNRLSVWHRARAEGAIMLDADHAFICNRNETGELVAVTFIDRTNPED